MSVVTLDTARDALTTSTASLVRPRLPRANPAALSQKTSAPACQRRTRGRAPRRPRSRATSRPTQGALHLSPAWWTVLQQDQAGAMLREGGRGKAGRVPRVQAVNVRIERPYPFRDVD